MVGDFGDVGEVVDVVVVGGDFGVVEVEDVELV